MKGIACVGLACVDLVNVCNDFPNEDTDQRMKSLHWQRGGNAANTSVVLSMLNTPVDLIASFPSDVNGNETSWGMSAAKLALTDLQRNGVGTSQLVKFECNDFPTSSVIANAKNGSRTIMHHRGKLPELGLDDIMSIDFSRFDWVHFEGRPNIKTIGLAIEQIRCKTKDLIISMELEKTRVHDADPDLNFAKQADLVFMSKDFATYVGCKSPTEAVTHVHSMLPRASVVCAWGSAGAAFISAASDQKSKLVHAVSPAEVVDTLGAGDSFLAGVIHAMYQGLSLEESVKFGCRVAEKKITKHGFEHVREIVPLPRHS